jgi:RNA polymerase sigma-70 factor (ECF subfamily)
MLVAQQDFARDDGRDTVADMVIGQEVARLYQENAAGLVRYGAVLAGNPEVAQDCLQETFLRYFMARTQQAEIESPRAWLYRVMRNCITDWAKQSASKGERALEEDAGASAQADPEEAYQRLELNAQILQALSPREHECARLRSQGLRYEEIAHVLGITSGTVGALLTRAAKKVRELG